MVKYEVDVLMITYNHENYIEEAINGVVKQVTNFNYRLSIFDDCSIDNTEERIKRAIKHNNPNLTIEYHRNSINLGMLLNGKQSFEAICSTYTALCEGDDYWTDSLKLQKQIDLMELTCADFCYTDFDIYFQEKQEFQRNIFRNNLATINIEHPLLTTGSLGVPTWVFKSTFLKNLNLDKHKLQDKAALMLIELLRVNGKVCFLSDNTTVYRRNLNSSSNQVNTHKRYLQHKLSFEFMLDYFELYYQDDMQTRNKINMLAINIISEAHDHQDVELINRIKQFLLECEINIEQILNKFKERDKLKENFDSLENSRLRKIIKKIKR